MADNTSTYPTLSLCVTVASKVANLTIKDGQLIFVKDKQRLAFDFNGKRTFYNQIEELSSEADRQAILAPVSGLYYFVLDTAVLWRYQDEWIQITSQPEDIIFIGTDEVPEIGNVKTLYVNKVDKLISVWDEDNNTYVVVSDYTNEVTEQDILDLFE